METKNKIFTTILIIILIGIFITIFQFSSQDAEKSKGVSRKVTESVVAPITGIDKLEGNDKENALSRADGIVRKIAHFSIYMLAGATAMGIMVVGTGDRTKNRTKVIFALSVGIIYAISDEIHQTFTNGRTGLITDVGIDTMRSTNRNTHCHDYNENDRTATIHSVDETINHTGGMILLFEQRGEKSYLPPWNVVFLYG